LAHGKLINLPLCVLMMSPGFSQSGGFYKALFCAGNGLFAYF
jgi:hypothetical protein